MGTGDTATKGAIIHWARAYDALVWVLTRGNERRFREHIVELVRPSPGESVLDVGCGTGTVAIAAKARVGPGGHVCGIDASPEMVARAQRKAAKAGVDIRFENIGVEQLPFADDSFDVVCSTLMLHHLTDEGLEAGIREIARVLRSGGRYLAVDIGGGKGHRHCLFGRMRKHASFDLDAVTPRLEAAGLRISDRGPVQTPLLGMSNLRYLLAAR